MQKPPVIVLAGGANSRFFPFNSVTHKGGITLHGESFFSRTLENLKAHNFHKIVIVISPKDQAAGALQETVEQFNQNLKLDISFALQREAKGMGDAVLTGIESLDTNELKQVAIIFPYQIAAGELLENMMTMGETCICTSTTDTPHNYGILSFNDKGLVDGIVEKPEKGMEPSNKKILGMYLVSDEYLEILKITPTTEYSFESALNQYLKKKPAPVLKLDEPIATLKYPWDLFTFQSLFFKTLKSFRSSTADVAETAVIDETDGPAYIDDGAKIGHATRIVGPAYIGKNAVVGDFSLVRESSLEESVVIGAQSEVARSILMTKSTIHRGYVGDSIIGSNSKLGAGFLTANKRFDRKAIPVEVKGKLVDSGRRALGVIMGENVQVGTLVNTMPGKCIGSNTLIFPGSIIYQNIPAGSTIRPNDMPREIK